MNKLLLIDGNNFYSRGFFFSRKNKGNGLEFTLEMLENLIETFPSHRFVFAFDTCKSKRRLEIFPEYKGNRKSTMDEFEYQAFKENLNYFIQMMKYAGYIVMEGHDYEADDYIAAFSSMVTTNYMTCIVSTDQDFFQLINPKLRMYDPVKRIHITYDRLIGLTGLSSAQLLDYKCIRGDKSDNIPGYNGIGEVNATKMLQEHGSFEKLFSNLNTKQNLSSKERLLLDRSIYDRNKRLCDLTIPMKDITLKTLVKKFANACNQDRSAEKLHHLMSSLNLSHMLKRISHEIGKHSD